MSGEVLYDRSDRTKGGVRDIVAHRISASVEPQRPKYVQCVKLICIVVGEIGSNIPRTPTLPRERNTGSLGRRSALHFNSRGDYHPRVVAVACVLHNTRLRFFAYDKCKASNFKKGGRGYLRWLRQLRWRREITFPLERKKSNNDSTHIGV